MCPVQVYIGLGGNLGDPADAINKALELIESKALGRVARVSSLYRTEPVGYADQPWFVNAAAKVETGLEPEAFSRGLWEIERELGREKERIKDGPRPIDLDILLWGELVMESPALVIPHPRMHERRFVLEPLFEIAPEVLHPRLGRTVSELLQDLDDSARVERIPSS